MAMGGFHFVTGPFTSHKSFLPDEQYAVALDNFVKGCSDMLLTDSQGKIFLGYRTVFPQPDWWYVGGRMMPGESPSASCSRLLKRELSLNLEPARFVPFTYNSLVFGMREQEPKDHGTCDINVVLTAELSDAEVAAIKFDPKEYGDMKWVTPEEILAGKYHPAVQYSCRCLLAHQKLKEMQACGGGDDAKLAGLAREYCALTIPPEFGVSEYKCVSAQRNYECDVT
eukprot:CAMPEP_0206242722 /NCGR_PEP_ID=MMETSP0047_2-20121206/17212_1 /ASSEMBLY_ACC=CAM_ASM_000192 /TAXON_ID=195065 /ORGANISM="Chroomonas mesostigmatica_cf, Strain CCMP1168" /LENGTH=225 /DNA_ID=CAMNT_0053667767 /DNA_START=101 /DNA_END=774 /DNA_ORIENTATION=+